MAAPPGAAPQKKGGCGGKTAIILGVVAVLGVLFLCAVGGGVALLISSGALGGGSKSVAYKHLPAKCEVVVAVDIQGIMDAPAIEKHVVPALDKAVKEDPDSDDLAAFLRTAQLNPKTDLHSAAVCIKKIDQASAGQPDYVGIIGGKLKPGKFMLALEKHGKSNEFHKPKTEDGLTIIEAKDEPVFITQASDGAIIISNQESLLKKAAKASSDWKDYEIPVSEQMVVVLTKEAARTMNDMAGPNNPLGSSGSKFGRGEATFSLDSGKVAIQFDLGAASDAKEAADQLNDLLAMSKEGGGFPNPEAKEVIDSVKVSADGKSLIASAVIPEKLIEDMAKEFAKGVEEAGDQL